MIEYNPDIAVKACIICPIVAAEKQSLSEESRLEEAKGLAAAIRLEIKYSEIIHLKTLKPATYFSRGFTERMRPIIAENEIELMVVDTRLSPIQQRNLERELQIKVIDRTALILEIFGERAQTKEGSLQVELAHLTYQRSRLVRSWTHLERQRGGAGFLGGPGETQIELDRRIIDDKIVRIKKDLEKVRQTRDIQRGARRKVPYPIVALVGYTNAGKSTLFNYLTQSNVMAADMLFATLDPTMRKITLPRGSEVIISDTVGFISDLPHELVMAFRATLEEVLNADIILHVRDVSNQDTAAQKNDVLQVLQNLGLEEIQFADNYVEVLNKADLLEASEYESWQNKTQNNDSTVLISAYSGYGCDELLNLIEQKLTATHVRCQVTFPLSDGKTAAWLHQNCRIEKLENSENTHTYTISIHPDDLARLGKMSEQNQQISIRK